MVHDTWFKFVSTYHVPRTTYPYHISLPCIRIRLELEFAARKTRELLNVSATLKTADELNEDWDELLDAYDEDEEPSLATTS